jgi:flagellar basal body rod protein FlgC
MSGNGYGDVRVTRAEDMQAYDRLPAAVRYIIQNAVANYSAKHIAADLRAVQQRFGASPEQFAAKLRRSIVELEEPEHTYQTYGPDHPEADAHGKVLPPHPFATWCRPANAAGRAR